jgi:uridine phosphorylase
MYRELTAADHRRTLGIEPEQTPDVLLLVGLFSIEAGARRFAVYLEDPAALRSYPAYLCGYHGLKVAVAACFEGPMAAVQAHTWLSAGVPAVVQFGWYGALQPGTSLGDVIVPRHAERQDGVSDWYLSKGILADATPKLSGAIVAQLRKRDVPVDEHAIYSTPALLAESREVIADWSRHGYQGVDMETAATFAVAKSLGARRAAALIRFDDLVAEEYSIVGPMPREHRDFLLERERAVVDAVLDAVLVLRGGGTGAIE